MWPFRRRLAAAVCVLALTLTGGSAEAGSRIALEVEASGGWRDGRATVHVRIANRGDEAARSVQADVVLAGSTTTGEPRATLAPGEVWRTRVTCAALPSPPGVHTALVRVQYADGTGLRHAALSAFPLATALPDRPQDAVSLRLADTDLEDASVLSLRVENSAAATNRPSIRLFVPEQVLLEEPARAIALAPRSATAVVFRVARSALAAGSRYTAVAVADWVESDGLHRSVHASAQVYRGPEGLPPTALALSVVAGLLLAVFLVLQVVPSPRAAAVLHVLDARWGWVADAVVLAAVPVFVLSHLAPSLLLADTMTVGGDTPAHNYLASHLGETLFAKGRIVSWAPGWWCGFPMFQFYFCLPYLLVALLDWVVPFNVAFKLVSVCGALALPAAAWFSARELRLPRPGPALAAVAAIPLLFDRSHTMWGVNLYSTLAGMIANSLSFTLMLPAIACVCRDMDCGRFRLRSALLLAALAASHFFTTVVAAAVLAAMLPWRPWREIGRASLVAACEAGLAFLLMAWWLVPLVVRHSLSVDFGDNWDVRLGRDLPPFVFWLLAPAALGCGVAVAWRCRYGVVHLVALAGALALFFAGYEWVSPVFVNVRLWPFIMHATLALAVVGVAWLLARMDGHGIAVVALLILALVWAPGRPNHVRGWAAWNFEGLERKGDYAVIRELIEPLRGTAGRLANDLHEDNNLLGSSRIFECVPHRIGKPIIEGGIVNSAAGSLFAYYVQGETSQSSAGFPAMVKPASFDIAQATRHLEILNVKHFIARWPVTQGALRSLPVWRALGECRGWTLFELTSHEGRYVVIPRKAPLAVRTADWKRAGLEWLYTARAVDQPFAVLPPGEPDAGRFGRVLAEAEFDVWLAERRRAEGSPPGALERSEGPRVVSERVDDDRIVFRTEAVGAPHIVKVTWYPNWKVKGAARVFRVTPGFMLVYPDVGEVELRFVRTPVDRLSLGLTALGWLVAAGIAALRVRAAATRSRSDSAVRTAAIPVS